MSATASWRPTGAAPAEYLLEVVAPRTNAALISPAEHLFAALALDVGAKTGRRIAMEISADHERRRFHVRLEKREQWPRLAGALGAAYPQADVRLLETDTLSSWDPAFCRPDHQVAACTIVLSAGDHLPLRTLHDRELDADAGPAQTDPVLGILGAMGDLPVGWRALAQLVLLEPAPTAWARPFQRLALENPVQAERSGGNRGGSLLGPLLLAGLLGAYLVGSSAYVDWLRGNWLGAIGQVMGIGFTVVVAVLGWRVLSRGDLPDPTLVREKISRGACRIELRLAILAPGVADSREVHDRLGRLVSAYRQFAHPAGNSLVPSQLAVHKPDLRVLAPVGRGGLRRAPLLNVRELACLWHLPQGADDASLLERTTARRRLPLPATVARGHNGEGCKIGTSAHQGQSVPIFLAPDLLRRHLLAVAKTRRGKSSLLLRIVEHLMQGGIPQAGCLNSPDKRCVVLVDPHRDLATAALGLVPPERRDDVVYLDVSNRARPFGINLLDTGLGWDRDQAVGNALRIFEREFDGFWGPRMEDAFRFGLMALFEANEAMCRDDPDHGRDRQHTVLEVPSLLALRGFRSRVLKRTADVAIRHWFDGYFDPLDTRLRLEIINPVQTKVHKYLGSQVARAIVGQPRSSVDFRELIRERKIVLINLNAFDVGEGTAALVGGTLLNLAARAISGQANVPPARRNSVTLVVDEFHTIPGADYELIFGELAKYGANMVLATQTLARLDRLTAGQQVRNLRAGVFSNLDGLFAFHTSAEDAAYLATELGGGLDVQDLVELGHYQCYARLSDMRTGERLPAFSMRLDQPAEGDATLAGELAVAAAARYGRDVADVDAALQNAHARIDGPRRSTSISSDDNGPRLVGAPEAGSGTPAQDGTVVGAEMPAPAPRGRRTRTGTGVKNSKKTRSKRSARSRAPHEWTGDDPGVEAPVHGQLEDAQRPEP